jgi:membrane protease YdiL (CAAX protease family)
VRAFMTRHPIASFLALFYGLGWLCFVPSLLGNQGFGIIKADLPVDPFRLLSVLFFALVPFIATRIVGGPGSVRRLWSQVRHVRVRPQWYVVAFFGPAAALFVVAVLLKGAAPIQGVAANLAGIPTQFMLGIAVLALFGNLWEETSWSGFVTSRLQERHGPLKASLIVAPLFGLYHLPLFFIIGGLSDSPARLPITDFPLYATFLLIVFSGPMRILLTWIYNSTGHSIPVTALFHASINATGGAAILAMYFAGIDGVLLYAALAVFAVIVIVATRGRLGLARPVDMEARPTTGSPVPGTPAAVAASVA